MGNTGGASVVDAGLDFAERLRIRDAAYRVALEAELAKRYGGM
jgi:hypothetical protein